ncbi:MAG TPA: hypothetical protein EYP14_00930, partial [Planctomycetaceae bacterium]|nr:hypothetical protein [Planctomycetaceae bacterium]
MDRSVEALEASLGELGRRVSEAEQAERELQDARRALGRIDEALQKLDQKEAQLFDRAAVPRGNRAELQRRCGLLAEWQELKQKLGDAKVREAVRRQPIEKDRELLDRVAADEETWLQNERDEADRIAAELDQHRDELTKIRERLRQAGKDLKLEQAAVAVDQAKAELQDTFDRVLLAAAGSFLIGSIESEYRSEHEPAVLREAREQFQRFTHHQFDLQINERDGALVAWDTQLGEQRQLRELSTGTRMHLLLAVRLAWLKRIERGKEPLPLFLDEALTTTDERRFGIVARAIEQWSADEGRQFFYLSARRHEVDLWERCTGRKPHHIDLATLRFRTAELEPDHFKLPEPERLPEPGTHTPEEYAALLHVPPLDPRATAESLHLFYLIRDDLHTLYRLMEQWRIATLGQLETLLSSTAACSAVPDPEFRRRLAARCRAARAWFRAWRQGRGKCV